MSMPGAVRALGLGDIRVDSALNEPLSAQIDIVGATREELAALTATVANREIFARYGADRPSFLSTATFKVGIDAQGRAVLNVRSAEAFTDPLVSFLVDLRWGKNEIVREYSLLLDPPNYRFPRTAAEAALAAATPATAPASTGVAAVAGAAPVAPALPITANEVIAPAAVARRGAAHAPDPGLEPTEGGRARVKVESGDTLRRIARRVGAATETQAQTLMIAIFRANPSAFDGNINRLHGGAILTIPTAADLAAVSSVDAKREVRAQMTAWRLDGRPAAARHLAAATNAPATGALATAAAPAAPAAPVANAPVAKQEDAPDASLKNRVQSLEQQLDEMHKQLASENEKIQSLKLAEAQQAAAQAPLTSQAPAASQAPVVAQAPVVSQAPADTAKAPDNSVELVSAPILASARSNNKPVPAASAPAPAPTTSHAELFGPVAVTLGLMIAGFAYVRRRVVQARSPADAIPESMLAPMPAAMPMAPAETHPFDAPPAASYLEPMSPQEAFRPAARPAPEVPQQAEPVYADTIEEPMPFASPESTSNLEIDIEALERSYLESLPADTAARRAPDALELSLEDPALADTTTVETVSVEPQDSDTHVIESDLNTVLMDVEALDRENHAAAHTQEQPEPSLALARMPDAAVHSTALDFNLVDLDATAAQHVQMPSGLHEQPAATERRMDIVDVLKAAIEKDPKRRDLRMKLLETYYSMASINQRAFMDVVRKLSRERDLLTPDDWKKVTLMGREIAADDILFADLDPPKEGKDLANCA